MYKVEWTSRFKKQYKKLIKQGKKIEKLDTVITVLARGETLPPQYNNHRLKGEWHEFQECHIEPDWLLIYQIENNKLILTLARTGSHSDLLNM